MPKLLKLSIAGMLLIGIGGIAYLIFSASQTGTTLSERPIIHRQLSGNLASMLVKKDAPPLPDLAITNADGKTARLSKIQGQLRVVNLWATWCTPCVKELPSLAQLQTKFPQNKVHVIPVNVDLDINTEKAMIMLEELADDRLNFYQDAQMRLPGQVKTHAFPTTIIYDAQGREIIRKIGELDWSSQEVVDLLNSLLENEAM